MAFAILKPQAFADVYDFLLNKAKQDNIIVS
jgi:hypothetical protein